MFQYNPLYHGLFFCLLFSTAVVAQPDMEAGKTRARQCVNCHGVEGNSQNAPFPILAGQKPAYLVNQLRAFREGTRKNGMMNHITARLSNQEINNIAAYFASLKSQGAGGDATLAKKGESKAALCFGCHGYGAKGMGVTPKLAGQHPAYLKKQLYAFKEGKRQNAPMRGIASMLSDDDINAVAEYMGLLK